MLKFFKEFKNKNYVTHYYTIDCIEISYESIYKNLN